MITQEKQILHNLSCICARVTYLPVCSPEALPERPGPDPGLQSAEHKGRLSGAHTLFTNWQADFRLKASPRSRPLVPSWRASLWVLRRDVSCSPGVCPPTSGIKLQRHRWLRKDRAVKSNQSRSITQEQGLLAKLNSWLSISSPDVPTPSLRLCSSSVRGAVAPSASMASAASLSWASSQRTPAATRWMFSMGEYKSCVQLRNTL